jgi:hypothetical protein
MDNKKFFEYFMKNAIDANRDMTAKHSILALLSSSNKINKVYYVIICFFVLIGYEILC